MYQKDKVCRITLRLTQRQFDYVKENADMLDTSPADFLRMVVNSSMAVRDKYSQQVIFNEKERLGRENDKADFNDIV